MKHPTPLDLGKLRQTSATLPAHGGDLDAATALHGAPTDGWLDLSTGINAVPYPTDAVEPAAWARLPSGKALDMLLTAARRHYSASPETPIVAAPGAQALIQLMPRLARPGARVAIAGPTYSEHAIAWAAAGADVTHVTDLDLHAAETFDAVVVVNPNNPTGRVWPAAPLMMLSSVLAARGGHLIVDESFADAAPQRQLSGHCGRPGLIVLRSFGKFFGLAGLRLGFALGPDEEIARLKSWLGPWAVSGPAISIATKAFTDTTWVETTRTRLQADSDALAAALTAHGFEIVGQTPLFVTGAHIDAATLHTRLAKAGIWTRPFDYAPTWLRFGVPDASDRARLVAALAAAAPRSSES